jgi:hypothetical protein
MRDGFIAPRAPLLAALAARTLAGSHPPSEKRNPPLTRGHHPSWHPSVEPSLRPSVLREVTFGRRAVWQHRLTVQNFTAAKGGHARQGMAAAETVGLNGTQHAVAPNRPGPDS